MFVWKVEGSWSSRRKAGTGSAWRRAFPWGGSLASTIKGVSLVRMSAIMSLLVGHDAAVCKAVPS